LNDRTTKPDDTPARRRKVTFMSTAQAQREHVATILHALDRPDDGKDAVIERSWRRCIDRYGLDPTSPSPPRYVPDRTLREHQDQADALIHVAQAGVEQLYRQVTPLDYVVLLTDARGIAVQFLGSSSDQREHQRTGLYLGPTGARSMPAPARWAHASRSKCR
jgi:transcriptional regulator of acetoin/glycerol metabolism